jgi:uncharacterized repeat protein (TIGR03803 family)
METIYDFAGTNNEDGQSPNGGVVIDSAGTLYGTTSRGGSLGTIGNIFEITP